MSFASHDDVLSYHLRILNQVTKKNFSVFYLLIQH